MVKSFNTNKIFSLIRQLALVAPAISVATSGGTPQDKISHAISLYTGYSISQNNFDASRLMKGWGGFISASLATKLIPAVNKLIKGIV